MIYVDELIQWTRYHGSYSAHAARVGARNDHKWCHLFADEADSEELHIFGRKLGMRREWFDKNHYDLTPGKRKLAVRLGAVQVDRKQAVAIWRKQRENADDARH